MFKAILFDFNGVLVNDLAIHEESYLMAAREMGFPLLRETVRKYISATAEHKRRFYFGDISDEAWARLFEIKTKYYFDLIQKKDPLFPDVREVLSSLAPRFLLGLLSNTPRSYYEKIFPRPLHSLFQETLFGDEVVDPKPSPRPLMEIMKRMGMTPDHCCYVGDSISDVTMAKRAGVKIFAVATGDNSREELAHAGSDWVLDHLADILQFV